MAFYHIIRASTRICVFFIWEWGTICTDPYYTDYPVLLILKQ